MENYEDNSSFRLDLSDRKPARSRAASGERLPKSPLAILEPETNISWQKAHEKALVSEQKL